MKRKITILLILAVFTCATNALEKLTPETVSSESSANLTDEQRHQSQTYIHQGLTQRQKEEECAKLKDPSACQGMGKTKFLGMDSTNVQMVAKMYSYFSGALAASGAVKGIKGNDGQESSDYCGFIPLAGEQLATFMQQKEQEIISTTPSTGNVQKEQLYGAARSHGARARSARTQGSVWGVTSACYGAMVATGKAVLDRKVMLKAGAAGFLTLFWLNEAKQQKKYEQEVTSIADGLPGAGDCNPFTQKNCYCSQPETQYDPQHCLEALRKNDPTKAVYQVPCTSSDGSSDPQCICVGLDNCMDKKVFSNVNLPGFKAFASSPAGLEASNLLKGSLSTADLASHESTQAARARKLLGSLEPLVKDPNKAPTAQEQAISKALQEMGAPLSLARSIATTPINKFGKKKANSFRLASRANRAQIAKSTGSSAAGSQSVLHFSSGRGKVGHTKKTKSNSSFNDYLRSLKNKKAKVRGGNNVLQFSQRAQRSASINKKKDKPLFEIISRRYKISGLKRLHLND